MEPVRFSDAPESYDAMRPANASRMLSASGQVVRVKMSRTLTEAQERADVSNVRHAFRAPVSSALRPLTRVANLLPNVPEGSAFPTFPLPFEAS
jgi:hypothetical protein